MDTAHTPDPHPSAKNLVICCDGTGNEISENISNVLKLYRCLRKTEKTSPRQMVFYDPGVGTVTEPTTWHRLKSNINLVLGLATGYGLDDNVLSAYGFLVEHYAPGDRIYLFGFSRGAYTVRVLAGLIHKIGLIRPEQANLAGSGLIAYKQYSGKGRGNDAEDLDDVGAINLDWSVGMLTGWAGWQVGVNCDYVDDHAFADYSFPAANCGGGLHNGHDM